MVLLSKKKYFLFTALILICQYATVAQASFTATLSPRSIGKNETVELRLMINNAHQVDQVIPPSLKDFIIVSGPNQESGMESSNGTTRRYIGITYLLKPISTGKFTIAGALAKADGKTLQCNSITLEVTKNASGNPQQNTGIGFGGLSPFTEPEVQSTFNDFIIRQGENLSEKISKNIFIRVEVSRYTCYVGEPVIVSYKLYTRLKSESSITKNPSFNGFSVIDLLPPGSPNYSIEKLNGREYNVYILRKSQLYPLQAGTIELESAEVENNIHFIKEKYINRQRNSIDDMFRDFTQATVPAEGIQDEKVTLQSKPAVITVKPLPEKGQSSLFKGAVGNFTIGAALEKNSFTTDDAGKLAIVVSGEGNMSMIIAPEIIWPQGIEPYEPQSKEQLDKFAVPVRGTKKFEYTFTVANPGHYDIPAIVFNFFDTKESRYKTVSTKPYSIEVVKGVGKKRDTTTIITNAGKTGKEQFFDTLFTNRWLIVVPLAVLIITGLMLWLQKDNKKNTNSFTANKTETIFTPQAINTITKTRANPLLLTEQKMISKDSAGFYDALNNELKKFLADTFQIPLAMINKKRIAEEADKNGIALSTSLQIQRLLDDIEWQLYTPSATEGNMDGMYHTAYAIVHALNATAP